MEISIIIKQVQFPHRFLYLHIRVKQHGLMIHQFRFPRSCILSLAQHFRMHNHAAVINLRLIHQTGIRHSTYLLMRLDAI